MFIGLDLGTSSLKAVLMNGDQEILAEHTVPMTVERPNPGWSEQDPASWCEAAIAALAALGAGEAESVQGTRPENSAPTLEATERFAGRVP